MPKSIQLIRNSTIGIPEISSYKLVVEAVNAENMSDKVFVNQRVHNFAKGVFEDTFVAVCTPTQLEDFEEDAPAKGRSYYRTNKIELVMQTPETIDTVFESVLFEVKKLVQDLEALDNLNAAVVYTITQDGVTTGTI